MSKRVVIVGGGLAGLSAAAAIASVGDDAGEDMAVTLLESRPRLGGRAGSFLDAETGEWIDTCQHVAMGCCTNLKHFTRMVGIDRLFQSQAQLLFIGPNGERCRFRDAPLPAPLHLLRAFMGLRYLTWAERRRLGADVRNLAHARWAEDIGMSFEEWLNQHARTSDLREWFWDVILVSALSETADRIEVSQARKVFVDGFLAHREGWRVEIPVVPLEEVYGRRVTDWLTQRNVTVRQQTGVKRLHEDDGRIVSAELRSGEVIEADEFIVAVPWHRVVDVVPECLSNHSIIRAAAELESAPIASVHLWFDRPVLDVPHAVLIGKLSQWVFRRATPADSQQSSSSDHSLPNTQAEYLQVVISASRSIGERSSAEVIDVVMSELAGIWPTVKDAQLTSSRVVTEHRAVFSPLPGSLSLRPDQQSPIANLQLAGDWTNTGWPATMEGAVKSGFLAAENVLDRLSRPATIVQSGLKPSWLARLLMGIRAD